MDIRPTYVEIDLDAYHSNIKNIKEWVKDAEVCAVIKANAYGHGSCELAPVALEAGATRLAVAFLDEALELRSAGINAPILILGYTPLEQIEKAVKDDITLTVFDYDTALKLNEVASSLNKMAKIHVKLDTGMGRLGYTNRDKAISDIEKMSLLKNIEIEGLFTHFAVADIEDKSYTNQQFERYMEVVDGLKKRGIEIPVKHVSNSAAILDLPDMRLDMVRAGIMTYGYYPSDEVKHTVDIIPVMSLKTTVSFVKRVPAGSSISYGRTFTTQRESVIATIPVGYADGYVRLRSGKAKVIVNGEIADVVGRICMDQCMVDVTDINDVRVGDEVILMGASNGKKIDADDIANDIGTISYEILCGISRRVPRIYIKGGKVIKVTNYLL
ncbi:MAG: alanine racemase [Thermoanaerobacteraceae bacterium]|nr:alanine racemase [Thermoanaerobacteraceae bacterium]